MSQKLLMDIFWNLLPVIAIFIFWGYALRKDSPQKVAIKDSLDLSRKNVEQNNEIISQNKEILETLKDIKSALENRK